MAYVPGRDGNTDKEILERAKRRVTSMLSLRQGHDVANYDVARFADDSMSPWMVNAYSSASGGQGVKVASSRSSMRDTVNSKLLNDRAVWASSVCANGMYSGMSNPATPWFKITTEDVGLREFQPVKEWLAIVEERIYSLFAKTNFYVSQKSSFQELANYGTSACFMVEHWEHQAVTYPFTWGEYAIGLDDANIASSLTRRADMSAIQIAQRFGRTEQQYQALPRKVREALDAGRYQDAFEVQHLVEPNGDRNPHRVDNLNLPYRDLYYMTDGDTAAGHILQRGGFHERPFWAPRWDVRGSGTYGRGPGHKAFASAKKIQLQELRKQQMIDIIGGPPMQAPSSLRNTHVSLAPRTITFRSSQDMKDDIRPMFEIDARAIGLVSEDIGRTEAAIDRMYFADLFLAISNMPGVQPRTVEEVARRNDEKLSQLGPAVERNENEQSKVAIQRAFGILLRTGQLPPMPDELRETPLKIQFTSILSQLMRAIGVGSIERTLGLVGNLSAIFPEVIDKIDADQVIDEYADRVGMPPSLIRSDDAVAAIREGRAQQQAAATAAAAAPAAAQGAKAAELLSKTDVSNGGPSLLETLMGGPQ